MEEIFNGLAAAAITLMTFISQRSVKSINLRFEKMEIKIRNTERLYKAETDAQKSKINELKSYNSKLMYELINKNLRHAQLITKKIEKVINEQENHKKKHEEIYGNVIHLKAQNTNNKTSIALQQKKLDRLYNYLKKEKK